MNAYTNDMEWGGERMRYGRGGVNGGRGGCDMEWGVRYGMGADRY